MEHPSRLFSCLRCHTQVVICTYCDRGQIYCDSICSKAARRQSCREAEKRYQNTPGGKIKHARRQRRYRARLRIKVTDHGSTTPTQDDVLQPVENKAKETVMSQGDSAKQCCFCKRKVLPWLRNGFLGHSKALSVRDLSYFRPP